MSKDKFIKKYFKKIKDYFSIFYFNFLHKKKCRLQRVRILMLMKNKQRKDGMLFCSNFWVLLYLFTVQ